MRRLDRGQGMPDLPVAEIVLHRARGRLGPPALRLAEFLEQALAAPARVDAAGA